MSGVTGLMLIVTMSLLELVWVSRLGFVLEVCTTKAWGFALILR